MKHVSPFGQRGFSLLELLVVVGLIGVISVIAVPMMSNSLGFFRLAGDARSVSNQTAVTKMRAASEFTRVRLAVNRTDGNFRIETWEKVPANCNPTTLPGCWKQVGGSVNLSSGVTFGTGSVATAPSGAAIATAWAPVCTDNDGAAIGNTACIMFNSRGVPIDASFAPNGSAAIYLTDTAGSAVYAVTVAATGMIRMWQTRNISTPNWVKN